MHLVTSQKSTTGSQGQTQEGRNFSRIEDAAVSVRSAHLQQSGSAAQSHPDVGDDRNRRGNLQSHGKP